MNYSKTIRLFDPFYGWGYHFDYYTKLNEPSGTRNDTGLCNRILHWELYYDIIERSKDQSYTIIVQNMMWPELAILNIPNTVGIDYNIYQNHWYGLHEHSELFFRTIFDSKNQEVRLTPPLEYDKILSMYETNNFTSFLEQDHWNTERGYYTLNILNSKIKNKHIDILQQRRITGITFRDKKFHTKLRNTYLGYIGIHIRRGSGVTSTDDDINSLDKNLIEKYKKYKKKYIIEQSDVYLFQQDKIYFDFIDFVLKIKPNQQFYISHDLPDEFILPYYEKYGNLIVTKKDNREKYENYFSKEIKNLDHLIKYGNIVENVTDLFSLASCKFIVTSPKSSWSEFAKDYSNVEFIESNEITNKITNHTEEFYNYMERIINHTPNIL